MGNPLADCCYQRVKLFGGGGIDPVKSQFSITLGRKDIILLSNYPPSACDSSMNILSRRTLLFTATLVALTTLSACSSSDDDDTDISEATTGGDADTTTGGTTDGTDGGTGTADDPDENTTGGTTDGTDVGTGTAGDSDENTTDGTDVGTGTAGDPGESTTGDTTGGDTTTGDTDLPEDVARRLERALSLLRGDPIELAAAAVERFDEDSSGVTETSREPATPATGNATGEAIEFTCANGGTASTLDTTDNTGLLRQRDVTFTNCRLGAFDVTGTARRGANPVPSDITLPAPFTVADLEPFYQNVSLSLVDSRDGSEISITDAQAFTNFSNQPEVAGLLNRNWATGGEMATLVDANGDITLAAIAVGIAYRDDGTGQIGTVDESGDVTLSGAGADSLSSITVTEQLVRDVADTRFTAGTIDIIGEGFSYVLDAANGDPQSFQLTVEQDGTTTSFTVPWSDTFNLDAFQPAVADLGLAG